jgi:hypothetical protein
VIRAIAAGDVNGDGYADLLVGAPGKTYGSATAAGVSFLYVPVVIVVAALSLPKTSSVQVRGMRVDRQTPGVVVVDYFGAPVWKVACAVPKW